jgi:MFS family permease
MKNKLWPLLAFLAAYELGHMCVQAIYTYQWPLVKPLGVSLKDSALPNIIETVAWTAKVVFGLISDRYSLCGRGHRIPYIVAGQLLTTLGFLAVAFVPPRPGSGWALYVAMAFLRGCGMATASVAVEGLAVDARIPERMGLIQNVMAAGRLVGLLLANLLGGKIADSFGLTPLCIYLAAACAPLLALPMALTGRVVEERDSEGGAGPAPAGAEAAGGAAPAPAPAPAPSVWGDFVAALLRRDTLALLLYAVTNNVGQSLGAFVTTPYLTEARGISLEGIGQLATIGAVFMFPGAALTGYVMDKSDLRWLMALSTAVNALATAAVQWTPAGASAFGYNAAVAIAGGVAQGAVYVVTVGLAMRSAPSSAAASYVSVVLGVSNASGIIGNVLGGELGGNLTTCFVAGGAICACGLASLPLFTAASTAPAGRVQAPGAAGGGGGAGQPQGASGSGKGLEAAAQGAAAAAQPQEWGVASSPFVSQNPLARRSATAPASAH